MRTNIDCQIIWYFLQERKLKVRSFLDNLSKENRALQELNATLEITARDSVAAKNYIEQHRNQLESALVAAKEQVDYFLLFTSNI